MPSKHSLQEAEAKIKKLRAVLVGLVGADTREELEKMEKTIRMLPMPDADKTASINAIHALIETTES